MPGQELKKRYKNIYKVIKIKYPVLWTGMKSLSDEGRDECATHSI